MRDGYYTLIERAGETEYVATPEHANGIVAELAARERAEAAGGPVAVIHVVCGKSWVHGRVTLTPTYRPMWTRCGDMHGRVHVDCLKAWTDATRSEVSA